jgi:hypothetical protein
MITFHPAARKLSDGSFIPMVTLRAAKGRMVGSKVAQTGNAFTTASEALEHAISAATRAARSLSFDHGVFACVKTMVRT